MKKLLFLALLFLGLSASAINLIHIPFAGTDTNRYIQPPWWQSNSMYWSNVARFDSSFSPFWASNAVYALSNWQCWQTVDYDLDQISQAFSTLPDAQTNSILSSTKVLVWSTNIFTMPYMMTNVICTVSNFVGITYGVSAGQATIQFSTDGQTWGSSPGATTNQVWIRLCSTQVPSFSGIPADPVITNVQVWGLSRPDLYGRTNATYGQALRVGPPVDPDDAVSLGWVSNLWSQTPWMSAANDVQFNGHALNLDTAWSQVLTSNGPVWAFLGRPVMAISAPPPNYGSIAGIAVVNATNVVVVINTNSCGEPKLQFTPALSPITWTWLDNVTSSYPLVTNGQWTIQFPMPNTNSGFVRVAYVSQVPAMLSIPGVASLSPRTVTNSTDTTWGAGAGLLCVDSNYVYVSVASNRWKRIALSGW